MTPWGFCSLPNHSLNGWSNHNVLTLWSQVPIPLLFTLSVCPSVCPSVCLSLFLPRSPQDSNWQPCAGPGCRDEGMSCRLFLNQISRHPIKHGNIDLMPHFWGLVFPLKHALFDMRPWWKHTQTLVCSRRPRATGDAGRHGRCRRWLALQVWHADRLSLGLTFMSVMSPWDWRPPLLLMWCRVSGPIL